MTVPPGQNETSPTPPPFHSVPFLIAKRRTKKKKKRPTILSSAVAYKTEYEMALGHVLTDHPLL